MYSLELTDPSKSEIFHHDEGTVFNIYTLFDHFRKQYFPIIRHTESAGSVKQPMDGIGTRLIKSEGYITLILQIHNSLTSHIQMRPSFAFVFMTVAYTAASSVPRQNTGGGLVNASFVLQPQGAISASTASNFEAEFNYREYSYLVN